MVLLLSCELEQALLCHSGIASTYRGVTPVSVGSLKITLPFSFICAFTTMQVKREAGKSFFCNYFYFYLFIFPSPLASTCFLKFIIFLCVFLWIEKIVMGLRIILLRRCLTYRL